MSQCEKELTQTHYKTISYMELLRSIKEKRNPVDIVVGCNKYRYVNGEYWMLDSKERAFKRVDDYGDSLILKDRYKDVELAELEIQVYEQ